MVCSQRGTAPAIARAVAWFPWVAFIDHLLKTATEVHRELKCTIGWSFPEGSQATTWPRPRRCCVMGAAITYAARTHYRAHCSPRGASLVLPPLLLLRRFSAPANLFSIPCPSPVHLLSIPTTMWPSLTLARFRRARPRCLFTERLSIFLSRKIKKIGLLEEYVQGWESV